MPQIPGEFVQSIMPEAGQPGARPELGVYNNIDKATPADFGAQVGQTLAQAGDMLAQHAAQRQQLANETNVNDVYANQFSPAARDIYQKYMALEGKDAEAQFPAYQQQLNELRQQYRSSLPNMMQQKLFDESSTHRLEMDLDGMARYGAAQTKAWEWNTHTAVMADLTNEAEANWNNPQRLQNVRDRMDTETADYGSKHGWSGDIFRAQLGKNNDALWTSVIKRQANSGDYAGAMKTYQDQVAAGRISGSAQGEMEKFFKPLQDLQSSQNAYGKVTGGAVAQSIASEAQRQGVDPSTALTIWSAEGGVTNPATKNPSSKATGIFQHINSTWQAQGGTDQDRLDAGRQIQLGVALAKENQTALARDLGRQPQPWEIYLAHQQGLAGATALLHADPNSSAADALGGNVKKLTWNGIPADATASEALQSIKGYVDRHALMYDPNGTPSAQNIRENYVQHVEALRQQALQDNPGDPTLGDRYVSHYEQQAGITLKADQMVDRAQLDQVSAGIAGPQGAKSWQEAMKNPQWAQAYADASKRDPSVYDRVDKAIRINAFSAWDPFPTAESNALHDELKGSQYTDRTRFESLDLSTYYGAMPIGDLNDLLKDQTAIRKQDQAQAQKHVSMEHAQKLMEPILREAGDMNLHQNSQWRNVSKISMGPQLQKYNQFVSQLDTGISNWRQNNGGKIPADSDIIQIGRGILFPGEPAKSAPAAGQAGGAVGANAGQPGGSAKPDANMSSANQPQIDFSKFKPENQDQFSRAVATDLRANGRLVNDQTIEAGKALWLQQQPDIAKTLNKEAK